MLIREAFYVEWEKLAENADYIGSMCACELGKCLVFRFYSALVTVVIGTTYYSFTACQPIKGIVLLNPQNNFLR